MNRRIENLEKLEALDKFSDRAEGRTAVKVPGLRAP